MATNKPQFIEFFPNCKYRYLDLSGKGKMPVSSDVVRTDLNQEGYDSFFTVNGFSGTDAKRESCINLNAFFCDIDKKLTPDEIEKVKDILDPTFIIETFHGFHFYWCLDEIIFKEEQEKGDWNVAMERWERIQQSIVNTIPDCDKAVKDIPRILRTVGSIYWKKTKGDFKITGYYKKPSNTYSMAQVEEAFPVKEVATLNPTSAKFQKFAETERTDFFAKVNEDYPIEDRDSFKRLISGHPDTIPPDYQGRNNALVLTCSLMKQAKWSKEKAIAQINKVGWHGLEKERGGPQEIMNTINSAYGNNYTYSFKHELINWNMSEDEQRKITDAFNGALKARKEKDKMRYSTYEREILSRYPYLRKNEIGIIFNYDHGVYRMMSDQEIEDIFYNGMYEDMLWGFRSAKYVSDKIKCLISIIPLLKISNDGGRIINVQNGLLNMDTMELKPHNPDFVSLIQYQTEYNKNAKCPIWEMCVDEWMQGDEKELKKQMLKQFSGYVLSSSMTHDKALFLVGDGGNGKSTFVDTIARVIGRDAVSHIDLESLYGQYGMHGLIGKRLNVIEEVHGNYYQSNKLKKLISGEVVTIDIKYKDQFTFRPQVKFIFAVNQMPRVDDTSTATERRICAIHFKNNFRLNPNTQLRSNMGLLAQELPGILNWMLDGAMDLAESGKFVITKEQTRMLEEYRQENSSVEGFISECLDFVEGEVIEGRELYETYKKWCQQDGRKFKANIAFTKEMKAYGAKFGKFTYMERTSGRVGSRYEGVKLFEDTGVYQNQLSHF